MPILIVRILNVSRKAHKNFQLLLNMFAFIYNVLLIVIYFYLFCFFIILKIKKFKV